ncbi:MAG TPA: UrcA family protein [Novosphingobium sp.]
MKRCLFAIAAPASLLLSPLVWAQEPNSGNQITALGRQGNHPSWLSTDGPNRDGFYTLRIGIADLDPATADGWARMKSRVTIGTGQLCTKAGALPLVGGRYHGAQRECWEETRSQALAQMRQLRASAIEGQKISALGIMARPLAR